MAMRRTFSDLLHHLSDEADISIQSMRDVLKTMVDVTEIGLQRDGRVHISELGYFQLKWYEERMGRNPQSGKAMRIPAQSRVRFKPERSFRDFVNRKFAKLKPKLLDSRPLQRAAAEAVPSSRIEALEALRESEKKPVSKLKWLLLIIPFLVLLAIILLWPEKDRSKSPASARVKKPVSTESSIQIPAQQTVISDPVPETAVTYPEPVDVPTFPRKEHVVQPGDNLWYLARAHYGNADLWPLIYSANIGSLLNPDNIELNSTLILPEFNSTADDLSESDARELADSYMQVYFSYKQNGKANARYYLWVASKLNPDVHKLYYSQEEIQKDFVFIKSMQGGIRLSS